MADLLNAGDITLRLLELQQSAKTLFAENYESAVGEFRPILKHLGFEWGMSPVEVCQKVLADMNRVCGPDDIRDICVVAATVDLIEASHA